MKKLADDQHASITTGGIYHMKHTCMSIQPGVD